MISATMVLATAWGVKPHDGLEHSCGLCGASQPTRHWKQAIKDSNTSQADLKSEWVCWACEVAMNDRRSRSMVLVTNDGVYRKPERKEVWSLLLRPPDPPFLLYLTITAHKHGIWRQCVATQREIFKLQCEELSCMFEPERDRRWMESCAALMQAGVRRDSIETGRYTSTDYLKAGVKTICLHEASMQRIRGTSKWAIVIGLMPARKDITDEAMA